MGADEALMLDPQGFVATCNSTNFFAVRKGEVSTSIHWCARALLHAFSAKYSAVLPTPPTSLLCAKER